MSPDTSDSDSKDQQIKARFISNEKLQILSEERIENGTEKHYLYQSPLLKAGIKFTVFIPQSESPDDKFPVLFFLPGVGATEKNFLLKTGYQKHASKYKFIVVGTNIKPDVDMKEELNGQVKEMDAWYMDALKEPCSSHFLMYSFVTKELPKLIENNFPTNRKFGICGHSMGGHGAIVCGLRNPNLFQSISAFAPASNPISWGQYYIFRKLLGLENKEKWSQYDSCALTRAYSGPFRDILVDQGVDDPFLNKICQPYHLVEASKDNPEGEDVISVNLRMQKGFGHSSELLEAVLEDHFKHHLKCLSEGIYTL